MSLYKKYELGDVLRDDGVKTFEGREIDSGRAVQIHLIMGQPGRMNPPYELLDQLKQLSPENQTHVLETGEQNGTPYIVTLPLEGFSGFRDWLAEKSSGAQKPKDTNSLSRVGRWKVPTMRAEDAPKPAPPPPPLADDRTMISPVLDKTKIFAPTTPSTPLPPTVAAPAPPPPPVAESGEFTRMFQAPPPPPAAPAVAPKAPDSAPPARDPGEFTRMFQAPASGPPPPAAATPVPSAKQPGEFTAIFQAQSSAPPANPPAAAPEPGGFTAIFQTPASAPPPPAPEPKSEPGGFTAIFQTQPSMAAPPPAPAAAPPKDPGEFTRMFQAPAPPKEESTLRIPAVQKTPAPAPAPQPPPPPVSSPSPGEFTAIFNAAPPPVSHQAESEHARLFEPAKDTPSFLRDAASASKPPTPPVNEYDRLFGGGSGSSSAPPAHISSPAFGATNTFATQQPSSAPASSGGPSEFTRLINTAPTMPSAPAAAPAAPAAAAANPAPAAKAKSIWPMVLLGVLLVAIIAGLVITLTRK